MRREEGLEQSMSHIRIYFGRKRIQQSMLKGMAKVMGGKLGECGIHLWRVALGEFSIFVIWQKQVKKHFSLISNHTIRRVDILSATCNGFIPGISHIHNEILKHTFQDK